MATITNKFHVGKSLSKIPRPIEISAAAFVTFAKQLELKKTDNKLTLLFYCS
jgi:hypothetical protein